MQDKSRFRIAFGCVLSFASAIVGCGGVEQFPRGEVTGLVTCEGKPVPKAIVYFEPVKTGDEALIGQQGFGLTDAEGRYVISTYGEKDGAVLGKHLVRVGKSETSPPCNCGLVADNVLKEVTVSEGKNDFPIELKKATAVDRKREAELKKQNED